MRPDGVGLGRFFAPPENTKLEYWDVLDGYEFYIHSPAAGIIAASADPAVITQGVWRRTNTSLTLARK